MPRVKIPDLYLDKEIYDHVEELSIDAHLSIKETIECLLYQVYDDSKSTMKEEENITERFEKCQGCKHFNPDVIEEHCSHDPRTWDSDMCYTEME